MPAIDIHLPALFLATDAPSAILINKQGQFSQKFFATQVIAKLSQ